MGGGRLRQVLPHGVMLVVSALLYGAASKIDVDTGGRIGPAVWPKAVIAFMGLLCAYEIVKRLVGSSFAARGVIAEISQNPATVAQDPAAPAPSSHPRLLAWGIGLVAAYVVLVPWLGFFLSTLLFLWAFPLASGLWRPALNGAVALAGALLLFFVFMRVAYISLPLGEGPFRALSLGLMRLIGVT